MQNKEQQLKEEFIKIYENTVTVNLNKVADFFLSHRRAEIEEVIKETINKKRFFPIEKIDGNPVSWKNGYDQALSDIISLLKERI